MLPVYDVAQGARCSKAYTRSDSISRADYLKIAFKWNNLFPNTKYTIMEMLVCA